MFVEFDFFGDIFVVFGVGIVVGGYFWWGFGV